MAFESFEAFLAMGGRGVYVWSSYGAFAVILIAVVVQSVMARRAVMRRLRQAPSADAPLPAPTAPARFERVAWSEPDADPKRAGPGGSA